MSLVKQLLRDATARAIAAKTSRDVFVPHQKLAEGRVVIYGDEPGPDRSRATRTEVQIGQALVIIHRNTCVASGMFSAEPRFNELEVAVGEQTFTLRIVIDPQTSQFNPMYLFLDDEGEEVGSGHGQRLDLVIAGDLLGEFIGGISDNVSSTVIDWIRDKLP